MTRPVVSSPRDQAIIDAYYAEATAREAERAGRVRVAAAARCDTRSDFSRRIEALRRAREQQMFRIKVAIFVAVVAIGWLMIPRVLL